MPLLQHTGAYAVFIEDKFIMRSSTVISKNSSIIIVDFRMAGKRGKHVSVEEEQKIFLDRRINAFYESDDTCTVLHLLLFHYLTRYPIIA